MGKWGGPTAGLEALKPGSAHAQEGHEGAWSGALRAEPGQQQGRC